MGEGRGIYSVAMFQKERHAFSVSFFLGSGRQRRRPPPFGIEMLRATKPPLRRGFACGKTLVQRKRAAGQMAGLKAAALAFDLALGRIGIYRVAMFQSKRAPAQKEARTKIEYTVPDLQSRLELAQNQEPPLNKAGAASSAIGQNTAPAFLFSAQKNRCGISVRFHRAPSALRGARQRGTHEPAILSAHIWRRK